MTIKTYSDFLFLLGQKESSGQYDRNDNPLGYLGKYQMGETSLIDAGYYKKDGTSKNDWSGQWTGKDGVYSKDDFLNSPQAQENAIRAFHDKVWTYIQSKGLDQYVGQTVGGIVITESGLMAGYHLLGIGNKTELGLRDFLKSDGKIIPKDANGTTISSYISQFSGYDISEATTDIKVKTNSNNIQTISKNFLDNTNDEVSEILDNYTSDQLTNFLNDLLKFNDGSKDKVSISGYNSNGTPISYTIQSGDTLSRIAQKYGTTVEKLLKANPWLEEDGRISADGKNVLIKPNEHLTIPRDSGSDDNGSGNNNISYPILPLDQIIDQLSSSFNIAETTLSPIILDLNGRDACLLKRQKQPKWLFLALSGKRSEATHFPGASRLLANEIHEKSDEAFWI